MSRFDYIKYDEIAQIDQENFKQQFIDLETAIDLCLQPGRAKSLVITKLEEAYMWIGKAIRDEQLERNRSIELNESRG